MWILKAGLFSPFFQPPPWMGKANTRQKDLHFIFIFPCLTILADLIIFAKTHRIKDIALFLDYKCRIQRWWQLTWNVDIYSGNIVCIHSDWPIKITKKTFVQFTLRCLADFPWVELFSIAFTPQRLFFKCKKNLFFPFAVNCSRI